MKIAVLGTGMVGQGLAARLAGLGHDVVIGTRDVEHTLARSEADAKGTPAYAEWAHSHPEVRLMRYHDAGAHAEIILNATAGVVSVAALEAVGALNLAGKVLIDLAVPLEYSPGAPPRLAYANTDSLGERIQRAFPEARVVKTLNTMYFEVMINPGRVPGHHSVFVAGEDPQAKETVRGLLREFGWPADAIIDLGGIEAARVTEMHVPLLFTLVNVLGTWDLNINVVRA